MRRLDGAAEAVVAAQGRMALASRIHLKPRVAGLDRSPERAAMIHAEPISSRGLT